MSTWTIPNDRNNNDVKSLIQGDSPYATKPYTESSTKRKGDKIQFINPANIGGVVL